MSLTGRKCRGIKLRDMTSRTNNTPRGASKSKNTAAARPLPNWGWLLAGLVIGLFIAFLAGLMPSATDVRTVADRVAAADQQAGQDSEPVFDFYTLLPESEVSLTTVPPQESAPAASPVPSQKSAVPPGEGRQYLLQAGSFRSFKDAERLRAKLLLEGHMPKVEKVTVGSGETWHRVQLGPFSDRATIDNVQQELAGQNVDTLLLQLK